MSEAIPVKAIVESLLFVSQSPLSLEQISQAMPEAGTEAVRSAIEALKDDYAVRNGGFMLHEVAGGWQFRSRPEYKEWIRRVVQPTPPRLSKPALETLSIIAYRQPVLRSEIEQIRGVNSGNTLRILMERKLIRVLGRREIPGRPLVYATAPRFLETFDLKSLKDLPTPKDIEGMDLSTLLSRQPATEAESAEDPFDPINAGPEENNA